MYAMKPEDNRKEYTNGEIVIVWQPELCTHAGICVKMLPQVYNPREALGKAGKRNDGPTHRANREMPFGSALLPDG